jgi:hypothetical protein
VDLTECRAHPSRLRHTDRMPGLVVTVQQDTREACEADLDRVCEVLGMVPILGPMRFIGSDRWLARAMPKAPVDDRGFGAR